MESFRFTIRFLGSLEAICVTVGTSFSWNGQHFSLQACRVQNLLDCQQRQPTLEIREVTGRHPGHPLQGYEVIGRLWARGHLVFVLEKLPHHVGRVLRFSPGQARPSCCLLFGSCLTYMVSRLVCLFQQIGSSLSSSSEETGHLDDLAVWWWLIQRPLWHTSPRAV